LKEACTISEWQRPSHLKAAALSPEVGAEIVPVGDHAVTALAVEIQTEIGLASGQVEGEHEMGSLSMVVVGSPVGQETPSVAVHDRTLK
jgi:hypothetical protein